MLAGQAPEEELLRRLAPAVGLHVLDLFILAGAAVLDDVAPVAPLPSSGWRTW
ncbi:hypothetical protein [Streptomyces sp. NPDC060322]|uniref:hypothetical protein n=1 Tax=Streptomyces sp. NPDC060322 TaxID=3347097 RepID=UPI0036651ACD